jgi:cytochrome c oxidase cbb3-type subunit 2
MKKAIARTSMLGAGLFAASAAAVFLAASLAGARAEAGSPPERPAGNREAGLRSALARAGAELDLGRKTYERYCIGCHGPKGDGKGPAAIFLSPKPRDFTAGTFKFASVPAGQNPRDEDLLRTITRGLRGTAMPSFRFVPEEERRAVIQYIKSFAPERWSEPPGALIARGRDPYDPSRDDARPLSEAIEKGRIAYHKNNCWQCHPSYLGEKEFRALLGRPERPEPEKSMLTEDIWGDFIPAPDFARDPLRASWNAEEIYATITAGIGGVAMPTMAAIDSDERWQIAYFIQSLTEKRKTIAGPPPGRRDPRAKEREK